MAAILCTSAAMPALAAWDRIGSVDVSSARNNPAVEYGNFGGRVESLALRSRGSDVFCRDVTATYGDGTTDRVFRGMLTENTNVTLDIPNRLLRRLDFNCRAVDRQSARLEIAADVGRYQAEWRRSPDWDRMWSRMFPWANGRAFGDRYVTGQLDTSDWITVGTARFQGPYDHEMAVTGWRGRNVDSIALRPLNDDARCTQVTATFANGRTRDLNIADNTILRRDRMTMIDLPGGQRNVERIDMTCHAEHGGMVTMQVLASK
jgi:hypothetical protein